MYPSTSSCNANNRSLDADDIAGILFLYPTRAECPDKSGTFASPEVKPSRRYRPVPPP
jgi:hypothetical protein